MGFIWTAFERVRELGEVYLVMKTSTSVMLSKTITALRKDGYMVLLIAFDRKSDDQRPLGESMEITFSESNDPSVVSRMAQEALAVLSAGKPANPAMVN